MCREFNIGNLQIAFKKEFERYNELKNKFEDLAFEASEKFEELYDENCNNIDDVHNYGLGIGYKCISEKLDDAIGILIGHDLMHIDKEKFIEDYYGEYLSWEEDFEEIDFKYAEIVLTDEDEKLYREERRGSRGKWQGGGFGIGGAITGATKAGAMNIATGALHSTVNFFGDMRTTAKTNAEKEKLFNDEDTLETLAIGVFDNVVSIHYAIVDALRCNGISDVSMYISRDESTKAGALLNNLRKGLIPLEKRADVIENIIYSDPYNRDIYYYLMESNGDSDRGIEDITSFLGMDISEAKVNIIDKYFSNLPQDTEENTLKSLELFKNYSKALNVVEIDVYLKKFDEILLQHDIKIRTVDGVLFDTREEAGVAELELAEIINIKSNIVKFTEKSLTEAIAELESRDHKTVLKENHLKELNEKLVETIRLEEQTLLNDKYPVNAIISEEDADCKLEEIKKLNFRNMDLLEKRIAEIEEKRVKIIEAVDREEVEKYYSTVVILNEAQLNLEIINIRNIPIRTEKVKEEKVSFIIDNSLKIMKKHNELLERARKYEVRINTVKEEKVEQKKGFFGFISKTIEKGEAFIDGIQEKREKEAWDFITDNGTRTIQCVINRS